jgi:sulfite reductase beta subunit-like hemoprotein
VATCPGAYTCNLGLTKTMDLGAALADTLRQYDAPQVERLSIKASGCPNACSQHWTADLGFYGNVRKIDGKVAPCHRMLLGGGYDERGPMRFGLAVQSIPARLAPEAVTRVLDHSIGNRPPGCSPKATRIGATMRRTRWSPAAASARDRRSLWYCAFRCIPSSAYSLVSQTKPAPSNSPAS